MRDTNERERRLHLTLQRKHVEVRQNLGWLAAAPSRMHTGFDYM